jgi:putative membrane protein insertion efficiency factor
VTTVRGVEVQRAAPRQARGPGFARACRWVILGLITLYQRLISPLFPPVCRFYPCCSDYAAEAVRLHGVGRGLGLAARRLLRCHPWHPGGFDPVPTERRRTEDA